MGNLDFEQVIGFCVLGGLGYGMLGWVVEAYAAGFVLSRGRVLGFGDFTEVGENVEVNVWVVGES